MGTGVRSRRPEVIWRISACIGVSGKEAVGEFPRHIAKAWRNASAMAADLAIVENHRQCKSNHNALSTLAPMV